MISRIALAAVLCAGIAGTVSVTAPAPANAQSARLVSVLSTLRGLGDWDFSKVVTWSRSGASRPFFSSSPDTQAEIAILDLGGADRNAVLAWLRGEGRGALYDRGATDSQIGGRRPATMNAAPTPAPNPYRTLELASPRIGQAVEREIRVLGGFAAVKKDGKAVVVCVSFKNVAAQPARRVLFEFELLGPGGGELGELALDRRGEFSPNVDINGWSDLSSWQSGVGHRGYGDNCTYVQQSMASAPLLKAATVTWRVAEVEY